MPIWVIRKNYAQKVFPITTPIINSYRQCNFRATDLDQLVISGVTFDECCFIDASFVHACITKTYFIDCDFKDATMRGTTLRGCLFTRSNLQNVNFIGVGGLTTCVFDKGCSNINSIKGATAYKDPLRMHSNWIVSPIYKHQPNRMLERQTSQPLERETLKKPTDSETLHTTEHYRSPPNKTAKKSESDDVGNWGLWDEEDYEQWLRNKIPSSSALSERKYEYMNDAVLECPDISEFRRYLRNV